MDKNLLTTFLDLLETRSFNRTADRLDISQSTVSSRIRQLEEMLGARLFERGRGGAVPTAAGHKFVGHSRSLLATWDIARHEVGKLEDYSGALRISAQFSLNRTLLLDWAAALQARDGELALHFEVDYSAQIVRDLEVGATDIGVMFSPRFMPDVHVEQIHHHDFIMVSTLCEDIEDVQPGQYLRTVYTPYFDRNHDERLPDLRQAPMTVGNEEMTVAFLERFGGSAYLPKHVVTSAKHTIDGLRHVAGAPVISLPVYSVVHVTKRHDGLIRLALDILTELIQHHGSIGISD